jgi:uncharacterized protein (TIGR02246 family)
MSASEPHLELMSRYAAAWGRADAEAAFEFFADDVVMTLPGRGDLAGVHRGREAVVACIRALLERTEGVQVEVLDALSSEQHVALLLREVATRPGAEIDLRRVNLYRIRDGKIVAITIFEGDQYAVDEYFAGSG